MILNSIKKLSAYKNLILKEISFQFIEKIIRVGFGLIVINALSAYLGPAKYGILNFIESYYLMLYGIAMFGLDIILTKKLVKVSSESDFANLIFNSAFVLFALSVLFYLINIIVLFGFIEIEYKKIILIFSLLILLNPILVIEYFLTSKNRIRYISIVRTVVYIISSSIKLIAIIFSVKLEIFIYIIMIENILLYAGYIYLFRKKFKLLRTGLKIDIRIIYNIINEAFPIFLYSLGAIVYSRIDILMIQRYLPDDDLGNYTAAFKLIAFMMFLPGILSSSFFPKIVSESDFSLKSSYIKKMYRYTSIISFCLFTTCYLLGPFMINTLFGEKFNLSLSIYNILVFIILLSSISAIYAKVIYSVNLQKNLLYKSLFGIILNVILNYYLINYFGVVGSAIATLISIIFIELMYDFFDSKLRPYHIFKLKSIIYYEK
jgi:O-antigen/teichoic acid export membrane protein